MIIEFGFTSQGNGQVRVYSNTRKASFTILTRDNLPFTHEQKHRDIWHLSDLEKKQIESEVKAYTQKNGSELEKLIVFGKVSYSPANS